MDAQVSKGLVKALMVVPGCSQPRDRSSGHSQTWNAWVATLPMPPSMSRQSRRWAASRWQTWRPIAGGMAKTSRSKSSPQRSTSWSPSPGGRGSAVSWRRSAAAGKQGSPLTVTSGS